MIQDRRVRLLNDREAKAGDYVLYWMQQSQRASCNPALECAIAEANRRKLPVVACFGLIDAYPDANLRHFTFMLQGLREVAQTLARRGIRFAIRRGAPPEVALEAAQNAALLVCDRGYLRHQRRWREQVAEHAPCRVLQVEGDVVVPVEEASDRHESAARTIRPKLHALRDDYLTELSDHEVETRAHRHALESDVDLGDLKGTLAQLDIDRSVGPVKRFTGGTSEARRLLRRFVAERLEGYADDRAEPSAYICSFLSPYLHFGQISPVEVALKVRGANGAATKDVRGFLDQLITWRELAMNFVHFEANYDRYECLPNWARTTLAEHRDDPRQHVYSRKHLEAAKTHDLYWNAAMREMVYTGYMHNYMRLYWAKKILEWTKTPKHAFQTTLYLNNKYFLDGRDPNSYANVAWIFGMHDRAWFEREVFGKVRYMNAEGLKRKFDMNAYIEAVDRLVAAEQE